MLQCAECQFCKIFEMDSGRRHYICKYGGRQFSAYGNSEEVSCPHFKLRSSPPIVHMASEKEVWQIVLPHFPPFARAAK